MTKKMGRPSKYSEELANRICELVATNPIGLPKLCMKYPELPEPITIREWRWSKPDFSAKYVEAKRFQSEIMAESIEDVIDDLDPYVYQDEKGVTRLDAGLLMKARLTVDSRKWTAAKLAPKIYGDKTALDQSIEINSVLAKEVTELRLELESKSKKEY